MTRTLRELSARFFCIGLYLTVFVVTRLPFFWGHFFIEMDGDYGSYAWEAEKLFNGTWPDFSIRPPLYPLILATARVLSFDAFAILLAQSFLTAVTGIVFLCAANRWRGQSCTPIALIALLGAHCSEQWLLYETTMSPDLVYANLQLLFIAALMLLVATKNWHFAIAASVLAGLAVWARPSGIVLFVVELLLSAFILLVMRVDRRWRPRTIPALLVPSLVLMILLSTANYFGNSKRFEFSIWGELNLAAATMFLWQERSDYPEALNQDIARIRAFIPARDMEVIRTSESSLDALYQSFFSAFNTYFKAQRIFPNFVGGPANFNTASYLLERPVIRAVAIDAITAQAGLYAKFVLTNLHHYLTNNMVETFRASPGRGEGGSFFDGLPLKERRDALLNRSKIIASGGSVWLFGKIGATEVNGAERSDPQRDSFSKRAAEVWFSLHEILYRNWLWPLAFLFSIVPITILAARRDGDFLVVGAAFLMVAGSAVLTSLVEIAITRYSLATLPQFYFCGAFVVWRVLSFARDILYKKSWRTTFTGPPLPDT